MGSRNIIAILLIAAAFAGFMFVIDPLYDESKEVAAKVEAYDTTLTNSRALERTREDLNRVYSTKFTPQNLASLEKLLPDAVDNVRLIIDVENIIDSIRRSDPAKAISLKNVKMGASNQRKEEVIMGGDRAYGSILMSFTVTASYDNFMEFIKSLEQSLRVIDIVSVNFEAADNGISDYLVTVKTYWLKPTQYNYL